ncbi:hypothetical protein V1477_007550 [Vespula maculifrons]|uniref:Uncharacterized protein n=1 Tax=Vespula maculifrons TaxID=7453 RepID=A0ABD2CLD7_VESMC
MRLVLERSYVSTKRDYNAGKGWGIPGERGTSRPIAATSVGELPTTLTAPTLPMFDTSDFRRSL